MRLARILLLISTPLAAQQPFFTDDAATTAKGQVHFEFFNEHDWLKADMFPSLRQNTANMKVNFGVTESVELNIDNPYLAIFRSRGTEPRGLNGVGDTNLGVKWNFHKERSDSRSPAFSATMYIEFPTGDTSRQLGSGLIDYTFNGIAQKSVSDRTKVTANLGIVFSGNDSTGLIGIQTRGRVFMGGVSVVRKFSERLTLGVECYGATSDNFELGRSQLQILGGGSYDLGKGVGITFALLGGKYVASPRVGGQIGFTIDFPSFSAAK